MHALNSKWAVTTVALLSLQLALAACQQEAASTPKQGDEMDLKQIKGAPASAEQKASVKRSLAALQKTEDPPVYPILKAYDWIAKDHAVYQHFLGKDKPPIPLVGYGYDTADNFVFVTKGDEKAKDLDALHAEAMQNIEAYQVQWEAFTDTIITASGKDFSAEKILCKSHLIAAQQKLGAKRILVGIPRRTIFYAANADAPAAKMEAFYAIFKHTCQDDSFGNAPITNLLFRYENGELIGAMLVD